MLPPPELRARLAARLPDAVAARLPEGEALAGWVAGAPEELVSALVAMAPAALEETARALVQLGSPAAPLLIAAEAQVEDRAARKALRRAIHALRSRGVPVEEPRRSRPCSAARLPAPEPVSVSREGEEAFLGPIDPKGRRVILLLVLARPTPRLYQVLASDEEGILRVEVGMARRREVRAWIREIRSRSSGVLVPAPPDAVRALLARLFRLGVRAEPEPAFALEADLGPGAAGGKTPGERIRERLGGGSISDAVATLDLRQRLERGEIAPWLLPVSEAVAERSELETAEESPLVLSPMQQKERRRAALGRLVARVLDPSVRERLGVRLDETAYLLKARGDADGARAVLRVAERIREEKRPEEIELVRMLLELSLSASRGVRKRESGGGLIVPG